MRIVCLPSLLLVIFFMSGSAALAAPCSDASNRLLRQLAEDGDLDARLYLARKLLFNECSAGDRQEGLKHLITAADSNHPEAQFELGRLLYADAESPSEQRHSRALIEQAAQSGLVDAQELYGVIIMEGSETAQQRQVGFYWLGSAASLGSARAAMIAFTIYKDGAHGVSPDACLAAMWADAAHAIAGYYKDSTIDLDQACQ